jgi:hypothetical protein
MAIWWNWWAEQSGFSPVRVPDIVQCGVILRAAHGMVVLALLACPVAGCRRTPHPTPAATLPATEAVNHFESRKLGIALSYPPGWVKLESKDYALVLAPISLAGAAGPSISLDVPELPFHLPGMIPIALVKNGYLDDLRKQYGQIETQEQPAPQIERAETRLVHSEYAVNGKLFTEKALLLIHGDRVYILRATAEADGAAPAFAAHKAIAKSLTWLK